MSEAAEDATLYRAAGEWRVTASRTSGEAFPAVVTLYASPFAVLEPEAPRDPLTDALYTADVKTRQVGAVDE